MTDVALLVLLYIKCLAETPAVRVNIARTAIASNVQSRVFPNPKSMSVVRVLPKEFAFRGAGLEAGL